MKLYTLPLLMLLTVGCNGVNRLSGNNASSNNSPVTHEAYIVACCYADPLNETYPTFLPPSQLTLCKTAAAACHNAGCQIGGNTYLPMHVDCGQGHGFIGDQYYVGKAY